MFNLNKEKDMENSVINNNEVVDMKDIIRIQKEYELYIDETPLVDCNMTVGEYWDRYGGGYDGYGPLEKDIEIDLTWNDKYTYLMEASCCDGIDMRKYDEEFYEYDCECGYRFNRYGEDVKKHIGKIILLTSVGWFEYYDENCLLRDAICEIIEDMESNAGDEWYEEYCDNNEEV